MFPRSESRLKTAFRRSLDAAIDFATLGEYGYAPAWKDAGAAGATAAEAPACAGQPARRRALKAQTAHGARQRDGMALREQHCVADAVA
jgi:hypothetical protein